MKHTAQQCFPAEQSFIQTPVLILELLRINPRGPEDHLSTRKPVIIRMEYPPLLQEFFIQRRTRYRCDDVDAWHGNTIILDETERTLEDPPVIVVKANHHFR